METEWSFVDTENKLGFGKDSEVEITIEFSATAGSPPGWEDPGEPPEVTFENISLNKITTVQNEVINFDTLSPEKLKEVEEWAFGEVEDCDEVSISCLENAEEYWGDCDADYRYEGMIDRAWDRADHWEP